MYGQHDFNKMSLVPIDVQYSYTRSQQHERHETTMQVRDTTQKHQESIVDAKKYGPRQEVYKS